MGICNVSRNAARLKRHWSHSFSEPSPNEVKKLRLLVMDKASHSPVVGHGLGRGEVDDDSLRGPCSKQATEDLSTKYTVEVNLELENGRHR